MTIQDVVSQGLFPVVFLLWAEFRFLPLVRTAMGWCRAHAIKTGVTEAEAKEAGHTLI